MTPEDVEERLHHLVVPEPSQALDRRVAAALGQGVGGGNQPETQTRTRSGRVIEGFRTMKLSHKILATAAAVVIAFTGLNTWLMSGSPTSGVAFADVVERIKAARSATYKYVICSEEAPAVTVQVMWLKPGRTRMIFPNLIAISGQEEMVTLMLQPAQKKAVVHKLTGAGGGGRPQQDFFAELRDVHAEAEEVLGEKQIDGQTAMGFRAKNRKGWDITLWVNPKTDLPVRVEMENGPFRGIGKMVLSEFAFDVELDESLFSLTPPPGYTVETKLLDVCPGTEQDLIEALRLWTDRMGGAFPPALNREVIAKQLKDGTYQTDEGRDKRKKALLDVFRGIAFVRELKADADWHYAGQGVKRGDATAPICWWKPKGSETYRVVYADLSVQDVLHSELPARASEQSIDGAQR